MARTYKQQSIVSGMTVDDILNMDEKTFDALSLSDLRKITGRLVSAGNRRIRTFERTGETSPAYRAVMESGGMFSTAGKTKAGIQAEFQRAKTFFQHKTSTVTGARRTTEQIRGTLQDKGVSISKSDFTKVFQAFNKLRASSGAAKNLPSDVLLKQINQYVKDHPRRGVERIATDIYKDLNSIYEEWQEIDDESGFDDFFDIE